MEHFLDSQLAALKAAGFARPRDELRALTRLAETSQQNLAALVERRRRREPFAYLAERQEFWSLTFSVASEVLIPRPESEHLVEEALRVLRAAPYAAADTELEIVEFGLGSGAILLALLSELEKSACLPTRKVLGLGIENNPRAVEVAATNARRLLRLQKQEQKQEPKPEPKLEPKPEPRQATGSVGCEIMEADWRSGRVGSRLARRTGQTRRLVLANPPYLTTREWRSAPPEVSRYEPRSALDGGPDGLAAYRGLVCPVAAALVAGERAILESTPLRVQAITDCFVSGAEPLFALERVVCDLAGLERVLLLERL